MSIFNDDADDPQRMTAQEEYVIRHYLAKMERERGPLTRDLDAVPWGDLSLSRTDRNSPARPRRPPELI